MNIKVVYRRLEWSSIILLIIITSSLILLFTDSVSLQVFKITLGILLIFALLLFLALRNAIKFTISEGRNRFKSAEFKFEKIYESSLIGIIISNYQGEIVDANDSFLNLIGYTRSELDNSEIRWDNLTPVEFSKQSELAIEQLKTNGECTPFEKQYICKDGSRVWVLVGASALSMEGNKGQAVTFVINISNRKESQEKTRQLQKIIEKQQAEFKSVFMNAPAFITIRRGPELRYDFVNKAVTDSSKRNDHIGKTPEELYPGRSNAEDIAIIEKVLKTGKPRKGQRHRMEYEDEYGIKKEIYLDYYLTPVFDQQAKVDGVAVFGFDVSDLVLANKEMEISKNRMEFIADTMPHKVWMADGNGRIQYLNKAWLDYIKLNKEDIPDWDWGMVIHPEERAISKSRLIESLNNMTEFSMENRLLNSNGESRWHLSKAIPLKDKSGELVMWIGTSTDIHDRKIQVEELKDNEIYFRTLADETPFMVWKSDVEGNCVYVNKKWVEFTGLTFEESMGYGFSSAMTAGSTEAIRNHWISDVKNRRIHQNKFQLKNIEGENRWVFAQANPFFIDNEFQGYVGSLVDITDQENASQALKDLSDRKDEFLSIASHELKTPLTSIKASVQLIAKSLDEEHKLNTFAKSASDQLLRLERLIADLLDVSKINAGKLVYNESEFDFPEMLAESVRDIQQTSLKHTLELINLNSINFTGDRFRIEQVIFNFLSNAIKYSPDADRVIVKLEIIDNNIVVSVQDFGIGIETENLAKTFDRYYRVDNTSMRFQGLGLGLFISSEILKRHHGNLWIESEPKAGSTFYFSLPLNIALINKDPETDHSTFYNSPKIDIRYDRKNNWIYADWKGFHNLETVQHGSLIILELMKKNQCTKILNDNTRVLGNWSDAAEWAGKVHLPEMESAGLKQLAWIYSQGTFGKLAAEKSVDIMIGNVSAQLFTERAEAEEWLKG